MNNIISVIRGGFTVILFLALGAMTSCGTDKKMSDYVHTVQSGIKIFPWPRAMGALFGDADHFITQYGLSPGLTKWNTEGFFGGRYKHKQSYPRI